MDKKIIDWLISNGCVITADGTVRTKNGDYVTLSTLDKEPIAEFIYNHKLTDLQSISGAVNGTYGCAVGIGFNKLEQKWYGFTHRGFGSFGIGFVAQKDYAICNTGTQYHVPIGFVCKTLDDCKRCAIAMSDYLD